MYGFSLGSLKEAEREKHAYGQHRQEKNGDCRIADRSIITRQHCIDKARGQDKYRKYERHPRQH